jgi:hypothetical protein
MLLSILLSNSYGVSTFNGNLMLNIMTRPPSREKVTRMKFSTYKPSQTPLRSTRHHCFSLNIDFTVKTPPQVTDILAPAHTKGICNMHYATATRGALSRLAPTLDYDAPQTQRSSLQAYVSPAIVWKGTIRQRMRTETTVVKARDSVIKPRIFALGCLNFFIGEIGLQRMGKHGLSSPQPYDLSSFILLYFSNISISCHSLTPGESIPTRAQQPTYPQPLLSILPFDSHRRYYLISSTHVCKHLPFLQSVTLKHVVPCPKTR